MRAAPWLYLASWVVYASQWRPTGRDAIAAAWRDARAAGTATMGSGVVTTWNVPTIVAGAAAVLAVNLATFS
ncbi:hypothetical protein [Arthrobacter sp. PM3]|uniref:hypothetical protein n=1 Tax=Arthrobacter sp. PM3 TaxID=2017685 RepID=UPI000E100EB4|nr:hypothetical protein [Arthrobacter sp. PM3]AXJ11532.1 hypothetical protein CFN17_19400 [Arthrobacter sp. PM3]